MLINFKNVSPQERYHITTSIVVPRPIAWVSTQGIINGKTITNIAPFSYFTPLSSEPATVLVSIGHRPDGSPKDTLRNLRETKKCSICIVDEGYLEQMNLSGTALDADTSEAEAYGIQMQNVLDDYPPVPSNIKAVIFGRYIQEIDIGGRTVPVIIEIDHMYINDEMIKDKEKMRFELDAVARMGNSYKSLGEELVVPS